MDRIEQEREKRGKGKERRKKEREVGRPKFTVGDQPKARSFESKLPRLGAGRKVWGVDLPIPTRKPEN